MEDTTKMVNTIKLADENIILDEWKGVEFKPELWKPEPIEHMDINITTHEARERLNKMIDAVNWLLERAK